MVRNTQKIGMTILLLALLTSVSLGVNLETVGTVPINLVRTNIGLGLLEACPAGQANCNGQCADLNNDTQNCGSCGNRCPPGSACVSGVCTEAAGSFTGTAVGCPAGEIYCNGQCMDLSSDAQNCGLCGNRCPPGSDCVSGVCTEAAGSFTGTAVGCPTGEIYCNGKCADLSSDTQNCGLCGNRCPPGSACVSGVCTRTSGAGTTGVGSACCPDGDTNCDGQCVNLLTDTQSCGRCGRACPEGTKCIDGACIAVACCSEGNTNCNGKCVNLLTDTQNCGKCSKVCPGGTTCTDGACSGASSTVGTSCPSGKINCNGQCVDPSTDVQNCGTCGKQCPPGGTCVSGVCTGAASTIGTGCPSGKINCNGQCVDPSTDVQNCGTCGKQCPSGGTCVSGVCTGAASTVGCPTGQINCNGKCVDLSSDPRNCGSCGRVCPLGKFCADGVCTSGLLQ